MTTSATASINATLRETRTDEERMTQLDAMLTELNAIESRMEAREQERQLLRRDTLQLREKTNLLLADLRKMRHAG